MFKSVFTKYITAFILIFLISFSVLAALVSVMVTDYSMDEKESRVQNASHSAKVMIDDEYLEYINMHPVGDFSSFIKTKKDEIGRSISAISRYSDLVIFIADAKGNICVIDENTQTLKGKVPSEIMENIFNDTEYQEVGDINGLLPSKHLVYSINLATGPRTSAVFACSSSTELSTFVRNMIETIITASMLVMVAGLIACYFISERMSTPLKDMSRAAKKFASGQFDVRVKVTGKDEIAELASAFNQMAESLAELEELRRSFLANISHDLRTPMTTISGFIEGILDGAIPPEKYNYYLNIIATEIKRLSRLVSTLLDISRLQAGDRKFNMAPFDICEMARQILISFEAKIDEKKLDVEFETESDKMTVRADSDAIHQILYNLIDNAIKFSYEKGLLRIKIETKDKKVSVSVYNEGMGIAEEDIGHVFDRFYKADKSRGLDKTGVGLGLFIAKTIIEAHNESISVESEQGKWCCFHFTLQKSTVPPLKPQVDAGKSVKP